MDALIRPRMRRPAGIPAGCRALTVGGWRRVLSYLGPHRGMLALAALASVAYAGAGRLLDRGADSVPGDGLRGGGADRRTRPGGPRARPHRGTIRRPSTGIRRRAVAGIIVFILALVVLKNGAEFARACLSARVEQGGRAGLAQPGVRAPCSSWTLAFFGRVRAGQIVSRLTHDVEQLRTLATAELMRVAIVRADLRGDAVLDAGVVRAADGGPPSSSCR